ELRDAENRIPFPKYVALMRAAKELCNDPAFALHFGESADGMEATLACMMGIFSPTIAESFAHIGDVDDGNNGRYRITRNGEQVLIVDTSDNDDFPEATESSFARTVCAARRLFAGSEFIKAVHFRHAEPPYRAEYDRVFRMPIVFRSDSNALLIDAAMLELGRREAPSQQVFEIMKARAETLLQRVESANSTRGRVEALLMGTLHTTDVSIDCVAGKLGLGRHTLFRRLRAEGVTFRQVLDELRHKLANQYLSERKLAVGETAYLLGFSDPAAFSRAYKRWTGHSPRTHTISAARH
ncbi:MAG TPA: AraC family transcriptional regulator ligand-binding domain-containing protein, partial [Thermoanaerobaculia bacterium]|nr:AraC family transcriptional regulator ligand-binding domain-containing protein [Thermoanaerobaculia bacterium]